MKIKQLLYGSILVLMSFNACKKSEDIQPEIVTPPIVTKPYVSDQSFKIVAYMPSYRDPNMVADKKYKMITHLYYAFLNPNPSGDGSLMALSQPLRFEALQRKAKANNVKFGISVSGTSSIFVAIASSPTARTNFVKNIVNFAKNNNLDGVDMDWEYPSTSNGSADTFILLMKELSDELHKNNMYLSAAVTPGVYAGGIKDGIKTEVFQYIDFVNLMQYDGSNYDAAEPLNHASYKMSVKSLDVYLIEKSLPKSKAIVGIPLYGRSASTSIAYRDIELAGANLRLNLATVAGVDYGYNGIDLVKQKAILAKERANGVMFWEFAHDSDTDNSLIKAVNDQLGRAY
jgi:chitinase